MSEITAVELWVRNARTVVVSAKTLLRDMIAAPPRRSPRDKDDPRRPLLGIAGEINGVTASLDRIQGRLDGIALALWKERDVKDKGVSDEG